MITAGQKGGEGKAQLVCEVRRQHLAQEERIQKLQRCWRGAQIQ